MEFSWQFLEEKNNYALQSDLDYFAAEKSFIKMSEIPKITKLYKVIWIPLPQKNVSLKRVKFLKKLSFTKWFGSLCRTKKFH